MLMELTRREKIAGIRPDEDLDIFMKALASGGHETSLVVEYILKILGLDTCANTLVGDEMLRGISGGQKKRLTTVFAAEFCYVPRSKCLPLGQYGISELIYEITKPAPMEPDNLDDDLVNAWATGLVDDGLWNNASAVNRVNQFLAGSVPMHLRFTDDDGRSSGSSSPGSVGSVETLIASHFGGINHPSLFSDHRILDLHNPWRSQARIGIVSLRVVHLLMTVIAHLR